MYQTATLRTSDFAAAQRISRKILRLLGGSRQEVASDALEAAVFTGVCPASADHPADEIPHGGRLPISDGIKKSLGTVTHRTSGLDVAGQPPERLIAESVVIEGGNPTGIFRSGAEKIRWRTA